ncbi:MAG: glycosyltransferase family 4 protein, partial [Magnetovibrio sp.]|nr:glycosyltransferase family 4 protein [Magnetovibrio sp.]
MTQSKKIKKVLFFGTEDWAFWQHRLPMALALKNAGFQVVVVARKNHHKERIEQEGLAFIHWHVWRGSINPIRELIALIDMARICIKEKPDIMFNVALKPILYGTICAKLSAVKHSINLFAGLGAVFIKPTLPLKLIRAIIFPILTKLLSTRKNWVLVQNQNDRETLQKLGIGAAERFALIRGSGIDLNDFPMTPEPENEDPLIVTMVSRMLWYKGVKEAVEAARILKQEGENIRIILVGSPDLANPTTVTWDTLEEFNIEGVIDWQGHRTDIVDVWKNSHIALLPSYGEGIPKSLLEAAAIGRPLVAFDASGSRDLVCTGENGILVPLGD